MKAYHLIDYMPIVQMLVLDIIVHMSCLSHIREYLIRVVDSVALVEVVEYLSLIEVSFSRRVTISLVTSK
jgi:hypothetical protein